MTVLKIFHKTITNHSLNSKIEFITYLIHHGLAIYFFINIAFFQYAILTNVSQQTRPAEQKFSKTVVRITPFSSASVPSDNRARPVSKEIYFYLITLATMFVMVVPLFSFFKKIDYFLKKYFTHYIPFLSVFPNYLLRAPPVV